MSNGGCSHKCVNIAGGFKCECPELELSMSSDNKTCHGKYKRRNLKKKKNQFSGVPSRGLELEDKTYKLKTSIEVTRKCKMIAWVP